MRRALPVLLMLLVAGCAEEPAPADAGQATEAEGEAAPFGGAPEAGLGLLRFAAGDANATVLFEDTFTAPNTCIDIDGDDCAAQERRFDLTPQVPADAPVELTIAVASEACVQTSFEVVDADIRSSSGGGFATETLSAVVLRAETGTVTLVLRNCSLFAGDPTVTVVPVQAEVRSAVRADRLLPYLPVAVELAAGDRVEARPASGDDLDDFVVVDPEGVAAHHAGPYAFNATAAGRHILYAKGSADLEVRGPAGATMRALQVAFVEGPSKPATGTEQAWDVEVPGIPLYVAVGWRSSSLTPVFIEPSMHRGVEVAVRQGDVELMRTTDWDAGPEPYLALGSSTYWYSTGAFHEQARAGVPFTVAITVAQPHNIEVFDVVAWVEA